MAARYQHSEKELSCPVCYNIFENPVVLSCSHSFCKACWTKWWKGNTTRECPMCKRRSSRESPPCNLALKNLCEAFLEDRDRREAERGGDCCSLHSEKLQLFCLDHLQPVCLVCRDSQQHTGHNFRPIDEAARSHRAEAQTSLGHLKEKLKLLQKAKGDWVRVMEEMIQGLSKEIEGVSDSIAAVEKQLQAPDVSFLQDYKATVERAQRSLPQEPHWPSEVMDVTKHLTKLSKHLGTLKMASLVENIQHSLRAARPESVEQVGEWMKSGLRKYGCKLTLDSNTINNRLFLSENNRRATREGYQFHLNHPERFTHWDQVLCGETLPQFSYWEVDWQGERVTLGVTYREIGRRGKGDDSRLGYNNKSWVLECSDKEYTARHDRISTPIPVSSSVCNKVGVYVNRPAGLLSFYTVSSDTLTHLHTFRCDFTGELLAGFGLCGYWSSVSLCQEELTTPRSED